MGRVQKKNAKNYLLIIIATSLACILCIATVVGGIHMAFGQDHKKQQDILYQNAQITKPVITQNLLTANINSRPDRKSTRLNSSHQPQSRMPSSA